MSTNNTHRTPSPAAPSLPAGEGGQRDDRFCEEHDLDRGACPFCNPYPEVPGGRFGWRLAPMSITDQNADGIPAGWTQIEGYGDGVQGFRAYVKGGDVTICGVPADTEDEERGHNCDQMGCGSLDHVLARFRLPAPTPPPSGEGGQDAQQGERKVTDADWFEAEANSLDRSAEILRAQGATWQAQQDEARAALNRRAASALRSVHQGEHDRAYLEGVAAMVWRWRADAPEIERTDPDGANMLREMAGELAHALPARLVADAGLAHVAPAPPSAPHGERERALETVLGDLLDGVRWWASQEDGVPEDVAPAFVAAHGLLGWSISHAADQSAYAAASPFSPTGTRSTEDLESATSDHVGNLVSAHPSHEWNGGDCLGCGVTLDDPHAAERCPNAPRRRTHTGTTETSDA